MPGFNIGGSGGLVPAIIETRRKHRWVFEALITDKLFGQVERLILQKAQRPQFKLAEPEMHHNQEVAYFAGKQTWEPLTLTWYDAENPDVSLALWTWINTVVNMTTLNVAPPAEYKKSATLSMVDGSWQPTERWLLMNCWPRDSNWNDLDMTVSDIATIEVVMRFDRAYRTA